MQSAMKVYLHIFKNEKKFCSRYTGASAAVDTWDQQEDDRGSRGRLRVLGKGTSPPEYN